MKNQIDSAWLREYDDDPESKKAILRLTDPTRLEEMQKHIEALEAELHWLKELINEAQKGKKPIWL